ncbi:MAG: SH3 domain-containing protein [Pseudomonadota bacterium]
MHHNSTNNSTNNGILSTTKVMTMYGCVLKIVYFLLLALSLGNAQAQTDFNISSSNPDLESEFKTEMDKWILQAYEGDRDAQFKVGVLFANDQFNAPDFEQAVYWYKQAARQGHPLAQYNLGHHYLVGEGVRQNESNAIKWWLKAAEQDHALAQFNIGRAYYLGIGTDEDHGKARNWFERATANGEPKSAEILEELGWTSNLQALLAQAQDNQADAINDSLQLEQGEVLESRIIPIQREDDTPPAADQSVDTTTLAQIESAPVVPGDEAVKPQQENTGVSRFSVLEKEQTADTVTEEVERTSRLTIGGKLPAQKPTVVASNDIEQSNPISSRGPVDRGIDGPGNRSNGNGNANSQQTTSVALYSNPGVRSVLIALTSEIQELDVIERNGDWLTVTHNRGFPVWVHSDFIRAEEDRGTVNGVSVNARSVPIVASGTKIGTLDNNEQLKILGKRQDWYRVLSPARFRAWVKRDEFLAAGADSSRSTDAGSNSATQRSSSLVEKVNTSFGTNDPSSLNDHNAWLFSKPPTHYTIQLASFDEDYKVVDFLDQVQFAEDSELHQFSSLRNDTEWVFFLYGGYSTLAKANKDKARIKQPKGWIRAFGKIQQNRCSMWSDSSRWTAEYNRYCQAI